MGEFSRSLPPVFFEGEVEVLLKGVLGERFTRQVLVGDARKNAVMNESLGRVAFFLCQMNAVSE